MNAGNDGVDTMELIRLDDRKVVSITGDDAISLLQGLITCDMPEMEKSGIAYGALLTPQGKVLFDFVLHGTENGVYADLPEAVVNDFLKRMKLYKLRAKVDLQDCSEDLAVFQAFGEDTPGRPDPRHADLGMRWLASPDNAAAKTKNILPVKTYHSRRIALGIPEAPHDFSYGEVFAHDIALDSLGGVSFQKGCYVGQEVVSRMEHRGTARRRVVVMESAAVLPNPTLENQLDILAGDRSVGTLGSHEGKRGIAIVRLDRVQAAQTSDTDMKCGDVSVSLSLPGWATYSWPDSKPNAAE